MELEKAGLLEEDHWMMEVNLEDMDYFHDWGTRRILACCH
jgi:hypothetical protein